MRSSFILAAIVAVAGTAACHAYVEPTAEPVGDVEVTSAPVAIESYPSTTYEGHTVYYYNNRWQYHDGARWVAYRHEPAQLQTYRTRNVRQSAPPAREEHEQRVEPGRQEAPPARRE